MTNESLSFEQIKALEDKYQLITYSKFPIALERGEGAYVFDSQGKKYLDFYGGHCVTTTGHCHPKVVRAIQEQAKELIFYSNIVYNRARAEAAQAVVGLAPSGITQVFFCNSGTEANETALKTARKYTGKTTIIAMEKGFHGRTYGSMSVTGFEKYRLFPPFVPGVKFAPFGQIEPLVELIKDCSGDVAAIILEPVQSMAGVKIAPAEYYLALRKLCDEHGIVLIFDEVQTGFGRTGANFFAQRFSVTPDLITCAKGIASGVPMGAVFFRKELADKVSLGEQGATFGGAPIACAAAKATAEVIVAENLPARAKELGIFLAEEIKAAQIPGLRELRGIGLLIGLEFESEAKKLVSAMLSRGIIIGSSEDPKTIRLIPPLIISKENCTELVATLCEEAKNIFT